MSDLKLTKPLQKGDKKGQVKLIQEWLYLHDEKIAIDNNFGSATDTAVRDFQAKNSLPVNGIVDQITFDALISPITKALAPIPANGKSLGELVVAYARQHLAQHPLEVGGQNSGPWVRLYMNGNEGEEWAWCAGFTCFCLKQACDTLNRPLPFKTTFSCDSLAAFAKEKGVFVSDSDASPGSFFLVRRTDTDWTHTGIVTEVIGDVIRTIEGNTNDQGSREGFEVCARTRGIKKMDFVKI
ncbi:peptidoglycan-binding protein [Methylomonas methanica]|uniref:Uncharacterized protein n=1 Tax=Methylomonas methanica TaxID=421 RepID=A0A177MDQ7_METMH|nr:peptidoglycan-binding protein [Methylomonas methanica]OAI03761.1 hypothetical protein A1332_15260 [Methylomonas methanica]